MACMMCGAHLAVLWPLWEQGFLEEGTDWAEPREYRLRRSLWEAGSACTKAQRMPCTTSK